jgi:hypothetical protein
MDNSILDKFQELTEMLEAKLPPVKELMMAKDKLKEALFWARNVTEE